jgi:hypothetical protein
MTHDLPTFTFSLVAPLPQADLTHILPKLIWDANLKKAYRLAVQNWILISDFPEKTLSVLK